MITVIVEISVKPELLNSYIEIAKLLTRKFRGRPGCLAYSFHQDIHEPTEFVLYEQWENQSDLDGHYEALVALVGPARDGEVLPERLLNMFNRAVPSFYNTL